MRSIKPRICNIPAVIILMGTGIMQLTAACSSKATGNSTTGDKFQVTNAMLIDTSYTKEYIAEIQSVQNVEIRARVKGFIEKIYADEGRSVQAGQVLFTFSSRGFEEEILKATAIEKNALAELKLADVELKNTHILVEKNIVSKSELEMAEAKREAILAKLDEARSAISVARLNLSFTSVKAPFNGVINRIPNKTGSLVDEGALLTTLSDNREVFAYFNVSESEYLDFIKHNESGKQTKVSLLMADNAVFDQEGFIETVESEIDKSSGNIAFRARFKNPRLLLKHGSSGKILMSTSIKNALIIPQKSTFEIQDKTYVFVIDSSNRVRMKPVIPKLRLPHIYIIEPGLTASDKIVYEGIQQMKEGDQVSPEMISMNTLLIKLRK